MLKHKITAILIDFLVRKKSTLLFLFLLVVFCANKVVAQNLIHNVRINGKISGIHFCRGSVDTVTFDTTGAFTGTVFSVELSDTAGVFGSPTILGQGNSTKIVITLSTLPSSNNYSIRVVRNSTPTVIGDTIKFITLTKPKSNFTFTNDSSCPRTPISFTNTSAPFGGSGILTYLWTLNPANPPNSNILNPIVAYPPTTGNSTTTYPARLVVTDAFGCKDTTVKNVTVRNKPKANLILDPFTTPNFSFTAPRTFSKCNSSSPHVLTVVNPDTAVYANYLIRWGDTTSNYDTSLFISAAQHSYSFIGARDLTYIVTNGNGCKDTQNIIVYIGTNPSISMPNPGNTTSVCLPRTIQFNIAGFSSNSSDTKYKIESSEGVQDSFVHPPPNVYNKNYFNSSCGFTSPNPYPNSFYLKIIASNSCGSSTQMVEPIQISRRPKADFRISPDTVVCLNNNLTFTNNSIRGVYINPASPSVCDTSDSRIWQISPANGWSLLPGSIMNGLSVTNSITVKFNTAGVYQIGYLVINNSSPCGNDTIIKTVIVNDTSRRNIFSTICRNKPIIFNGQAINTAGIYRDTLVNSKGCDSFLYLSLTVIDTTRKDSFRTICKNESVVFNGVSLNTSGVYRDTFVNSKGCDSFVYLHLIVNDVPTTVLLDTICKNQSVVFNGVSLNTSGVYRDTFVNSKGCDSFLYLILTVNDTTRKDSFRTICKNQFVVFNGVSLNTSGVYRDTFVNSKGCDSFLYLILTVNDTTRKDSFRTICKNQSVVFNGVSLNTSGVYRDTFVNSKGCDSFLYLILTVNDTTRKDSFRSICRYQPITFNGQTLSTSGVYRDTLVNSKGCDSFLVLNLTVNDTTRKDSFRTICANQPLIFNGQTLNISGVYRDTLVNSKGCDSFLVLNLTVNYTTKYDSFLTICANQPLVFNGQTLNISGVYRDTLVNSKGCDSFLYLILTVNDTTKYDSFLTICRNYPVIFNGVSRNVTGIYKDKLVNSQGCDSFVYLHLTVNDTTRKDSFRTICKNQPLVFNGKILNTSGVYRDTLVNSKGCDSFLVLNLTVNDTTRKDSFRTICKNQSVVFNGSSLNTSGVYRDTFVNAKGCDSFLVLNLIVNDTTRYDSFLTICKNYPVIFNGFSRSVSGTYKDTLVDTTGCVSFVYLHLTVNDVSTTVLLDTTCKNYPKLFNGSLLNVSGLYRDTLVNSKGCDSFIFYSLFVKDTSKFDSFYIICKNQSVVFNGVSLNTSGVYRDTLVNAIGCDSFLVLNLTVNDTTKKDSFLTVCKNKNYPIIFNGVSLIASGTYKDTLTNVKGCDSFVYLHLIVNDVSTSILLDTTCKNYPKLFNGSLLNVSGLYRDTLVNSKGCDSFIFYSLFVKDTSKFDSFYTICKKQSVVFNGVSLNTSGIYRDTLVNAIGCDSFLVLHLTVNEATKKDSFLTICKNKNYPVIFNGQILNTSGVYQDTLVNSKGCDSFLFLILTVNDRTMYDTFLTICKNYPVIFNGVSRNLPGVYKDTMVNSQGCDSFIHLHLTVMDTTRKDSFLTIFNNRFVVFNGQTLNTSGIYRDTLVNSNGCDSFLVLSLTVNDTINALADILLPNYFSPNGDGENDNWVLPDAMYSLYPNLKVIIYNRWGNIVWRSTGVYHNDWGGVQQKDNLPVPDGVYYYLIELDSESKKPISGFVEVMRQ